MARSKKPSTEPLPTIWNASDELWERVSRVLEELDPPSNYGPDRIDQRAAFDGIIYRMRSGVQWNHLPERYGDDSSVHRTFQRWVKRGVLQRLWAELVKDCEELDGADWRWQSADCALGKARHGGIKSEPIRRTGPKMAASAAF
jgi:putative transposase